MKSLRQYIAESKALHQNVNIDEKLVINKNYKIYNYHPKNKDELLNVIKEHYDNDIYNLNDIDVSKITDFSELFVGDENTGNKDFDVSEWNVSKCKDFSNMFKGCEKFNCDLSEWDVSSGEDFSSMFYKCHEFNSNLSHWDVSNGEDFSWMFGYCDKFNSDISEWKISNKSILYIQHMFYDCPIDDKYKPKGVE